MSLHGIRHGAIIRCDIDGCAAEFTSYSYKHLVRAQAIAARWIRAPRWLVDPTLGKGREKVDICPEHRDHVEAHADKIRDIERALGRPLPSRAILPGEWSDPRILVAREQITKRLAERGKQTALEAYLELVKWSPLVPAPHDTMPAEPSQGVTDADRARTEQPQEDDRQGEADPKGSQGRRRSPRHHRADRDQHRRPERGGDSNDRARQARSDEGAGHAPAPHAGAANVGSPDAIVELHRDCGGRVVLVHDVWRCDRCNKAPIPTSDTYREGVLLSPIPPGSNFANGLSVVAIEIPRRMPRARRNGDGPSVLDVIAEIMGRQITPRTMNAHEIVTAATGDLELPTNSKTPHTIVSRDLALDVKHNGAASRFVRTAPGRFALRAHLGRLGIAFDDQSAEIKDSFSVEKTHPEGADHG